MYSTTLTVANMEWESTVMEKGAYIICPPYQRQLRFLGPCWIICRGGGRKRRSEAFLLFILPMSVARPPRGHIPSIDVMSIGRSMAFDALRIVRATNFLFNGQPGLMRSAWDFVLLALRLSVHAFSFPRLCFRCHGVCVLLDKVIGLLGGDGG